MMQRIFVSEKTQTELSLKELVPDEGSLLGISTSHSAETAGSSQRTRQNHRRRLGHGADHLRFEIYL